MSRSTREALEKVRLENLEARRAPNPVGTRSARKGKRSTAKPRLVSRPVCVALTLPEPPSANRWWRRSGSRMHLSKQAKDYKAAIGQLAGAYNCHEGPVRLVVVWHRGRKSGDLDKRLGVMLDALQGVLYVNDSQIVEIHATRRDDPRNARVEVTVTAA